VDTGDDIGEKVVWGGLFGGGEGVCFCGGVGFWGGGGVGGGGGGGGVGFGLLWGGGWCVLFVFVGVGGFGFCGGWFFLGEGGFFVVGFLEGGWFVWLVSSQFFWFGGVFCGGGGCWGWGVWVFRGLGVVEVLVGVWWLGEGVLWVLLEVWLNAGVFWRGVVSFGVQGGGGK